ncbi:hypothetical protein AAC387_Pa07g1584 [Persea americana]
MKQKIVIKVAMNCQDCRSKAMEIAAVFEGVISVAIEGKDLDLLVITGNEVDSPCLIKRLRKKVGYADLVTIAEVKPKSPEKPKPPPCPVPTCCSGCSPPCPGSRNKSPPKCQRTYLRQPSVSMEISESGPNCSIM